MTRNKILILGGGLAGLSVAWHLNRKNAEWTLVEKEASPGGLCRSRDIDGFTFDRCGHLLHFRHSYTFHLIRGLLGENLQRHKRNSWINLRGSCVRYPFQANLYGLPAGILKECLLGFIRASRAHAVPDYSRGSFGEWIETTFGRGIARHFMVPYNRKFWTVEPGELTCEWMRGFIPVPSLNDVVDGTVHESSKEFGYNANFWYPVKGGIERLVKAFAADLPGIQTSRQVSRIDLRRKEVSFSSGGRERYDVLVSTLPLPEFFRIASGVPAAVRSCSDKLRWNSICNLNLGIRGRDGSNNKHWIYFPQEDISFFRVGYFHNFSPFAAPAGCSALYVEVSYSREQPLNRRGFVERVMGDLRQTKVTGPRESVVCREMADIEYAYPIYDRNYSSCRKILLDFLAGNSVAGCGRYGSWRYMSMEDVIIDGKNAAEKITA